MAGHELPPQVIDKDFEMTALRRSTDYFILADPTDVILVPRVQKRTDSGGYKWTDGDPRPVQTFKLIEQVSTGDMSRGEGGVKERMATFTLLGQWDAVVEPFDHWEHNGQRLEVTYMMPYNGYSVRALVDSYGARP